MLKWLASLMPGSRRKEKEKDDLIRKSNAAIRRYEDLDERAQRLIKENSIDSVFAQDREGRRHADY